jgi:hypothetical protein
MQHIPATWEAETEGSLKVRSWGQDSETLKLSLKKKEIWVFSSLQESGKINYCKYLYYVFV